MDITRINDKTYNKLRWPLYILFCVFYLMNSQIKLPYGGTLRWCVLFAFMLLVCIMNKWKISMWGIINSPISWFVLMMVPSFIKIILNTTMILRTISLFAVLVCFVMLFQYATVKQIDRMFLWFTRFLSFAIIVNSAVMFSSKYYLTGRFRGILDNPNACSCIAMFAVSCALYQAQKVDEKWKKRLYTVIAMVSYLQVILTQSRMGFVSATIAFILIPLLFNSTKSINRVIYSISFVVIIMAIGYVLLAILDVPVIERLSTNSLDRKEWAYALAKIKEAPLFGHGYSMSAYHQDHSADKQYWSFFSSYLELIVDCGYYGLVVFLIMMMRLIIKVFSCARINKAIGIFAVFIITGLMLGVSESYMFSVGNPITIYFWFVVVLTERYCLLVKRSL